MPDFARALRRPGMWSKIVVAAVVVVAGCDLTGQYEANFQKALETSARRAVFDLNLHSTFEEVMDGKGAPVGVKLRLPKVFDANSKRVKAGDKKGFPAAAMFPGAISGLERPLDDASGQFQPAYVIFAAIPKSEQKSDALQASLLKAVNAVAPGAALADVDLPTPEGSKLSFKRLRVSGQQAADAQKKAPLKLDGLFDVYFIEAGPQQVLIAWVAPKGQAEKYNLEQVSEAAMGTVQVAEQPADGAGKGAASGPAKAPAPGCG